MAEAEGGMPQIQMQDGSQPTPEQIRAMQAQLAAEAQKAGMTIHEYVEKLKEQAMREHQQRQMAEQQAQAGEQVPITPGPPKPEAIAVANFLRSQDLKPRTCIFQEKRKDMFKVKRAIRALFSPAYQKARQKNPLLPEVNDRVSAENVFKLLPISLLALRVAKHDPHEGHDHGKKKRVKGLWTVQVVPQQEADDEFYYVWLYEGSQWKNKLYAVGALTLILAVVFFPVWPYHLRLGVWYLSMAMLGLLGLFFAMAIFRLILYLVTMFTHPPGLWLYPNLFEDVGFFDSFKPVWAWHEDEKAMKKRKKEERERKKARREAKASGKGGSKVGKANAAAGRDHSHEQTQAAAVQGEEATQNVVEKTGSTGTESTPKTGLTQRNLAPQVEEVDEDED